MFKRHYTSSQTYDSVKNLYYKKKTLWPLFMDGVQVPQGYRATSRRQFTFYHSVPKILWYSFNRPWEDGRLHYLCSHSVVLNLGSLDRESGTLTTKSMFHESLSVVTLIVKFSHKIY